MEDVWNKINVPKFEAQKLCGQTDDSHENTQSTQSVHGARCETKTSRVGRRSVAMRSTAMRGEERKCVKNVSH
jgi:hypothetical protein